MLILTADQSLKGDLQRKGQQPEHPASEKYFIKDAISKSAVHHESFEALWETKWKKPCELGIYPFMFGSIHDFQPVAEEIIMRGLQEPYDWDEYASMFFPKAEALTHIARDAEQAGEVEKASEYYLRSSAVYRIARFPTPRSPKQKEAWAKGKQAFYKGQSLRKNPIQEVLIPHIHRHESEGAVVPVNYLLPPMATASNPVPLLLIITGLDGYRTELAVWQQGFYEKGIATLVAEIPGTGDSPASPSDPTSPDRQWSSVLDWITTSQPAIAHDKIIVWGFSTGGYYALRIAHTHATQLYGAISLGGGCHHMFDTAWLHSVNKLEYPFDLANTLSHKFGYPDLDSFAAEARDKFSLLTDGTLDRPCARMLLVNGNDDEIFPIDDMFVALERGGPKEARMVRGKKHMGEPDSFFIILRWLYQMWGLEGDIMDQIKTLPSRTRY